MNKKQLNYLILIFSCLFYLLWVYIFYLRMKQETNNIFIYPLDDSYIHMAIARNLSEFHVWGINKSEFASASSSPLFTILLSCFYSLFGENQYFSLFINICCAILVLSTCWYFFRKRISPLFTFLLLFFIIIATPLPHITLIGMEHLLHGYLTLLYFLILWAIIVDNKNSSGLYISFCIICFFLPLLRYEGLFFILSGSMVLSYLKKFKLALSGIILSLSSVCLIGIFFISKGGLFLPYALVLKTSLTYENVFYKLVGNFPVNYTKGPFLSLLLTLTIIFLSQYILIKNQVKSKVFYLILIFCGGFGIFSLYSSFSSFGRYEAFLFPVFFSLLFYNLYLVIPYIKKTGKILTCIFFTLIFISSGYYLFIRTKLNFMLSNASKEIFSQQYQTALFIKEYYNNQSVAINDIGFPSYLTNAYIIDIYGLGNTRITISVKDDLRSTKVIENEILKNNANIACIYTHWFNKEIYKNWIKIGEWEIQKDKKLVIAGKKVTVFSISKKPEDIEYLINSLKDFNKNKLPENVKFIWKNNYTPDYTNVYETGFHKKPNHTEFIPK